MRKERITNQKPCESCHAVIRATKGNTFCDKCQNLIQQLNQNWKTHEQNNLDPNPWFKYFTR